MDKRQLKRTLILLLVAVIGFITYYAKGGDKSSEHLNMIANNVGQEIGDNLDLSEAATESASTEAASESGSGEETEGVSALDPETQKAVDEAVSAAVSDVVAGLQEGTVVVDSDGNVIAATSDKQDSNETETAAENSVVASIPEDGTYTSKDEVALYIHTYGKLPGNYITKKEAKKLGWPGGSLEEYAPGKCIGGDKYSNFEGTLPERGTYHECDIDTLGAEKRGAKRIVYSDDGRIYYTGDHYESFEQIYGEE